MAWLFAQGSTTKRLSWLERLLQYALFSAFCSVLVLSVIAREQPLTAGIRSTTICQGLFLWALLTATALYFDFLAECERRKRKTIRGTRIVSPDTFTRLIHADGLGVPCLLYPRWFGQLFGYRPKCYTLRIRRKDEPAHILLCGDTGMGKST